MVDQLFRRYVAEQMAGAVGNALQNARAQQTGAALAGMAQLAPPPPQPVFAPQPVFNPGLRLGPQAPAALPQANLLDALAAAVQPARRGFEEDGYDLSSPAGLRDARNKSMVDAAVTQLALARMAQPGVNGTGIDQATIDRLKRVGSWDTDPENNPELAAVRLPNQPAGIDQGAMPRSVQEQVKAEDRSINQMLDRIKQVEVKTPDTSLTGLLTDTNWNTQPTSPIDPNTDYVMLISKDGKSMTVVSRSDFDRVYGRDSGVHWTPVKGKDLLRAGKYTTYTPLKDDTTVTDVKTGGAFDPQSNAKAVAAIKASPAGKAISGTFDAVERAVTNPAGTAFDIKEGMDKVYNDIKTGIPTVNDLIGLPIVQQALEDSGFGRPANIADMILNGMLTKGGEWFNDLLGSVSKIPIVGKPLGEFISIWGTTLDKARVWNVSNAGGVGYQVAVGLKNGKSIDQVVGSSSLDDGSFYQVSSITLVATGGTNSYPQWIAKNPDKVISIYQNGYDADGDGEPDFTGDRAVWEAYIDTLQPWQRALVDTGTDPLTTAELALGATGELPGVAGRAARLVSEGVDAVESLGVSPIPKIGKVAARTETGQRIARRIDHLPIVGKTNISHQAEGLQRVDEPGRVISKQAGVDRPPVADDGSELHPAQVAARDVPEPTTHKVKAGETRVYSKRTVLDGKGKAAGDETGVRLRRVNGGWLVETAEGTPGHRTMTRATPDPVDWETAVEVAERERVRIGDDQVYLGNERETRERRTVTEKAAPAPKPEPSAPVHPAIVRARDTVTKLRRISIGGSIDYSPNVHIARTGDGWRVETTHVGADGAITRGPVTEAVANPRAVINEAERISRAVGDNEILLGNESRPRAERVIDSNPPRQHLTTEAQARAAATAETGDTIERGRMGPRHEARTLETARARTGRAGEVTQEELDNARAKAQEAKAKERPAAKPGRADEPQVQVVDEAPERARRQPKRLGRQSDEAVSEEPRRRPEAGSARRAEPQPERRLVAGTPRRVIEAAPAPEARAAEQAVEAAPAPERPTTPAASRPATPDDVLDDAERQAASGGGYRRTLAEGTANVRAKDMDSVLSAPTWNEAVSHRRSLYQAGEISADSINPSRTYTPEQLASRERYVRAVETYDRLHPDARTADESFARAYAKAQRLKEQLRDYRNAGGANRTPRAGGRSKQTVDTGPEAGARRSPTGEEGTAGRSQTEQGDLTNAGNVRKADVGAEEVAGAPLIEDANRRHRGQERVFALDEDTRVAVDPIDARSVSHRWQQAWGAEERAGWVKAELRDRGKVAGSYHAPGEDSAVRLSRADAQRKGLVAGDPDPDMLAILEKHDGRQVINTEGRKAERVYYAGAGNRVKLPEAGKQAQMRNRVTGKMDRRLPGDLSVTGVDANRWTVEGPNGRLGLIRESSGREPRYSLADPDTWEKYDLDKPYGKNGNQLPLDRALEAADLNIGEQASRTGRSMHKRVEELHDEVGLAEDGSALDTVTPDDLAVPRQDAAPDGEVVDGEFRVIDEQPALAAPDQPLALAGREELALGQPAPMLALPEGATVQEKKAVARRNGPREAAAKASKPAADRTIKSKYKKLVDEGLAGGDAADAFHSYAHAAGRGWTPKALDDVSDALREAKTRRGNPDAPLFDKFHLAHPDGDAMLAALDEIQLTRDGLRLAEKRGDDALVTRLKRELAAAEKKLDRALPNVEPVKPARKARTVKLERKPEPEVAPAPEPETLPETPPEPKPAETFDAAKAEVDARANRTQRQTRLTPEQRDARLAELETFYQERTGREMNSLARNKVRRYLGLEPDATEALEIRDWVQTRTNAADLEAVLDEADLMDVANVEPSLTAADFRFSPKSQATAYYNATVKMKDVIVSALGGRTVGAPTGIVVGPDKVAYFRTIPLTEDQVVRLTEHAMDGGDTFLVRWNKNTDAYLAKNKGSWEDEAVEQARVQTLREYQTEVLEKLYPKRELPGWIKKYDTLTRFFREKILFNWLSGPRYVTTQFAGNSINIILSGHGEMLGKYWNLKNVQSAYKELRAITLKNGGVPQQRLSHRLANTLGYTPEHYMELTLSHETPIGIKTLAEQAPGGGVLRVVGGDSRVRDLGSSGDLLHREVIHDSEMLRQLPAMYQDFKRHSKEILTTRTGLAPADADYLIKKFEAERVGPEGFGMKDVREFYAKYTDRSTADRLGRDWQATVNKMNDAANDEVRSVTFSGGERKIDAVTKRFILFHYFASRQYGFFLRTALDHPALAVMYFRAKEGLETWAEEHDLPGWAKGYIGLLGGPMGLNYLLKPQALVQVGNLFADPSDKAEFAKGVTKPGKWLMKVEDWFMVNPVIGQSLNALGTFGDAKDFDPLMLWNESNLVTLGVNYLRMRSGGRIYANPVPQLGNELREKISGLSPWKTLVRAGDKQAEADRRINQLIVDEAARRGILLQNKDGSLNLDNYNLVAASMEDPNSELYRAAMKRYVTGEAAKVALRLFPPTSVMRPTTRPAGERGTDISQGMTKTDNKLINLTSTARELKVQETGYYNVGTEREKQLDSYYDDITQGHIDTFVDLNGKRYSAKEINSWDYKKRKDFADAVWNEYGALDRKDEYKKKQDEFLAKPENAEFATFSRWRKAVYGFDGGVQGYWKQVIEKNPNAKIAYDEIMNNPTLSDAEKEKYLTNTNAYLAVTGTAPTAFDPEPERTSTLAGGGIYDPTNLANQTPAATPIEQKEESDFQKQTRKDVKSYEKRIAEYDQAARGVMSSMGIDPNTPYRDLPSRTRGQIYDQLDAMGIKKPSTPDYVTKYYDWIEQQEPGADTSLEAYFAWDKQQYRDKAADRFLHPEEEIPSGSGRDATDQYTVPKKSSAGGSSGGSKKPNNPNVDGQWWPVG